MSRLREDPGFGVIPLRVAMLVLLLMLAACARPLTPGEKAFAHDILGDSLDVDKVRIARDFGLRAPATVADAPPARPEPAPEKIRTIPGICDRKPQGPRSEPPPAFALWNRIHLIGRFYRPDTAPGWPDRVALPQALILAHELVHVWQWQNRRRTGYRPARAALESMLAIDPYYYRPEDADGFLSYGFEQQGALVEDYFCYALFDPVNPRRAELRRLLAPHFPVARLDAVLAR